MNITFTPAKAAPPAGPTFTTSGINGITPKSMSEAQIQTVQGIFKAFQEKLVPTLKEGSEPTLDNITEMNFKSGMIIGSVGGKARYVHVSVLTPALQTEYQNIQSKLQEEFHCKKEKLNSKILDPNSSTSPVLNTQRTAPRGWVRPSLDLSTLGLNTWFSNKADARFEYYSQQTDSKGAGLKRDGKDPVYIHDEALQFFDKERRNLESKYASVWCSDPNDSSIQMKIAEEARDRAAEFVRFLGGSNADRVHLYSELTNNKQEMFQDLSIRWDPTKFEEAMQRKNPVAIPTAPTASMAHRIGAIAEMFVGRVRGLCEPGRVADPDPLDSSSEGRGSSCSTKSDEAVSGFFSDVGSGDFSPASLDVERGLDVLPMDESMQDFMLGAAAAEDGAGVRVAQEEFLTNLTGKVAAWQEKAKELLQNKETDFKFRQAVLTAFAKNPTHQAEIDRLFDLESETVRPKDGTPCILDEGKQAIITELLEPIYEPAELEEAWKSDPDFMLKAITIYPWIVSDAEDDFSIQDDFIAKMLASTNQHPAIRDHDQKRQEELAHTPGAVGIWQAAKTETPTQAPLKGTELWLSRLTMDQLQKHSENFSKDHIAGEQAKEGALPLSQLIQRVRKEGLDKVFKDNKEVLSDLKSVLKRYNPQNTGFGIGRPFNVKVSQSLIEAAFAHKKGSLFG
ncbi:MAG: hypothetical protein NT065_03110 [Chlamydiae bacterium]|nr:hypothetical protein [Chlamydiota bacterium]